LKEVIGEMLTSAGLVHTPKYENVGLAVISELLAHQFFSDNFCLRPGWFGLVTKADIRIVYRFYLGLEREPNI
jgi:hypothetical protein